MGVSWVVSYSLEDGRSAVQAVEELQHRIVTLGAVKTGMHIIDSEPYFPKVVPAPVCHVMHNYDNPATSYAILESGTCLKADNALDLLIMKMKTLYDKRSNQKIECKGSRYELEDFVVKVGTALVTQTNNVLGVLLEVEYLPSSIAGNCFGLLKEFIQGVTGRPVEIPNYLKLHTDELWSSDGTMQQYLEHFNAFKKAQLQAQQI